MKKPVSKVRKGTQRKATAARTKNAHAANHWAKIMKEYRLPVFVNDVKRVTNLEEQLKMLMEGCLRNDVGIMVAKRKDTGAEEVIFVGIMPGGGVHPLMKPFSWEEGANYIAPTGTGGWAEENDEALQGTETNGVHPDVVKMSTTA